MKLKLTTLLFGLLLAVGWTSNASAQSATYSAESIKDLTYTWQDANGVTQTSPYVQFNEQKGIYESVLVTNPYQIYGLLRGVYMEKALPGPYYSAYTPQNLREDPVYYGGIEGGWDIGITSQIGNITITPNNEDIAFRSIEVRDGNQVITSWTSNNGTTLPSGWNGTMLYYEPWLGIGDSYYHTNTNSSIVIPSSLLAGHNSVQVIINAREYSFLGLGARSISVNGSSQTITTTYTDHTWTINAQTTVAPDGTYKPNEEGYTAIMVAIKNDAQLEATTTNGYQYTTVNQVITYIGNTIESVKLLTDGLRIGSGYDMGTVFNCDGTYNKFFILGKGQARKKSEGTLDRIADGTYQSYHGEEVPFKFMYEQFSPTQGDSGSQINDFYNEMMKGNVYNVVHDCASVIQQSHQFSMSGNAGTDRKSFTGLNFFIPDYRLKHWTTTSGSRTVDGRDMNPYTTTNTTTGQHGTAYGTPSRWAAWFAQYNQAYAPKMGIYLITLSANAEKTGERLYDINLEWTSSLNEMAGENVPQKYVIYEVLYDENGNEYLDSLDIVTDLTEWKIENFPQPEHSVTRTFIIKGWPTDSDHPSFIAWSNRDQVVIPGYNDFLALTLNHYESDFVVGEEKNYYRNFLTVSNENEENALTIDRITSGESNYTLFRYDMAKPDILAPVADLGFQIEGNPATAKYVQFTVSYGSYGSQDQLHPAGQPLKYNLESMGVLTTGDLCLHGNGDLIIQPNGPTVNFHSIVVKNGNGNTITSWTESNGTTLPNGWKISPGSTFELFDGVYYLEGHGYIYIPASVLGNNTGINVTITASADAGSLSRITVNDVMKRIANSVTDDYTWTDEEVAYDIHEEDGMVRMGGLPIVDQFSASTAKNDHPNRYGYVLKYKPNEEGEKKSGTVEVPVQHTKASVNGFYTEDDVINDTDRELKTDVLEADVTLNLSATNSDIYHYILLSDNKNVVPEVDDARTDYVSYLQRRSDFTYREMNENSPLWVEDNTFGWPAGELEYFNNDNDFTTGGYGDFKTYVPVVETTGYDRRWYEVQNSQYGDHLHNTYGSPIWKTSAGKVDIKSADAQPQEGWNTTWKNGEENCRLYMLDNVEADGYLPSTDVTNIEYEPYMFRIFVESKNGKLRHFDYVINEDGNEVIAAVDGDTDGPWCVWSEYITLDENGDIVETATTAANGVTFQKIGNVITFNKNKVDGYNVEGVWNAEEKNAIFGAVNALANENELIDADDLTVYIRFYYRSTGSAIEVSRFMLRADGDQAPEYYAAEGDSQAKQTPTGVSEIRYHGEVVSQTYYNVQGIKSDKPFDGVNIVVTRYSDGTTSISKVVK